MMAKPTTRSGLDGWRQKLRSVYGSFDSFLSYDEYYGISQRLGYKTPQLAWRFNPMIEGSVNPADLCKVYANGRRIYPK